MSLKWMQNSLRKEFAFIIVISAILVFTSFPFQYTQYTINTSTKNAQLKSDNVFEQDVDDSIPDRTKIIQEKQNWTTKFKKRVLDTQLFGHIQIRNETECSSRKLLVYTCGQFQCKGCGDRMKGMAAMFLVALLSNRIFVIDMHTPCNFEKIFQPNVYNWTTCLQYVRSHPSQHKMETDSSTGDWYFLDKHFDFRKQWTHRIAYVFTDTFMFGSTRKHYKFDRRLRWMSNLTNAEVVHLVLNTLFKPSDQLYNDVNSFYNKLEGKRLACAHVRTGMNPLLHFTYKRDSANQSVMNAFLSRYDPREFNIFILGDHPDVKVMAKEAFSNFVSLNYTLVDLELYEDDPVAVCEGFHGAFTEWFILTTCDVIVISESGFGCTSLFMRGSSENVYAYKSGEVSTRTLDSLDDYCRVH